MDPIDIDSHLMNSNLKQLIMFTGLDVANNSQHSAIYNAFMGASTKKEPCTLFNSSTHPINYKMLTADNEIFRRSDEKNSFLKKSIGILKQKWTTKFLFERPVLVVCFADLDWDHVSWYEKKTECESKINSLRYIFF